MVRLCLSNVPSVCEGVFSSICLGAWRTTTPGGGTRLEAALGLAVGVAWLPEGPLGYPVRGSQGSNTQGSAPAESPLLTPTLSSGSPVSGTGLHGYLPAFLSRLETDYNGEEESESTGSHGGDLCPPVIL